MRVAARLRALSGEGPDLPRQNRRGREGRTEWRRERDKAEQMSVLMLIVSGRRVVVSATCLGIENSVEESTPRIEVTQIEQQVLDAHAAIARGIAAAVNQVGAKVSRVEEDEVQEQILDAHAAIRIVVSAGIGKIGD